MLFVSTTAYIPEYSGGVQSCTAEMCTLLERRGGTAAVLAGRRGRAVESLWCRLVGRSGRVSDDALGYRVDRADRPVEAVAEVCDEFRPDAIVVQIGKLVRLTRAALATGVPTAVYFHGLDIDLRDGAFPVDPRVTYLAASRFVAARVAERLGLESHVVPPIVLPERYRVDSTRDVVTFVNPRPSKGLDVVLDMAEARPDIPFEIVEAWPLRARARKRLLSRLSRLPNVKKVPRTDDMRTVYGRSRVVLAPSRCDEAWGRIVTEAQINGIPVIATRRGGLPEAVGNGGILVDDSAPPAVWVDALSRLWDDSEHYSRMAASAGERATEADIDADLLFDDFLEHISDFVRQCEARPDAGPAMTTSS